MCHEPSSCLIAFVRPAPTSEPASGSVSTIVAPQCFAAQVAAHRFCSSVPSAHRVWANAGPEENMCTPGFDPSTISATDQRIDGGVRVPPNSSGRSSASKPDDA